MTCKRCRFYEFSEQLPGVCKRFPPKDFWQEDQHEFITHYQIVDENGWCGEHVHLEQFECFDCGLDTLHGGEYYMVKDEIWEKAGDGHFMLCTGCLEQRIGRTLSKNDFADCQVNKDENRTRSARLQGRMISRQKTKF